VHRGGNEVHPENLAATELEEATFPSSTATAE